MISGGNWFSSPRIFSASGGDFLLQLIAPNSKNNHNTLLEERFL
jgi:hypothetical protein